MISIKNVRDKVYKFKNKLKCVDLNMFIFDVTNVVHSHLILVLNNVSEKLNYVKVMTVII